MSLVEDLDDFGPTVLEEIDALIPSDVSSFNEVEPARRTGNGRGAAASDHPGPARDLAEVVSPEPVFDVRPEDGRRLGPTPLRLPHVRAAARIGAVQVRVQHDRRRVSAFGCSSCAGADGSRRRLEPGDHDFTDLEVSLLDALRPHLVQAYRHAQLITEHRRALEGVAVALAMRVGRSQ